MGMQKRVYQVSTGLLVLIFGFAGLCKVSPVVNPTFYDELRHEFGSYVRTPPVDLLRLQPTTYMLIVGVLEIACVVLIVVGKYRLAKLATWALLVIILGALYTHVIVGHPPGKMVPAAVCLALILVRLYTMGALNEVHVKVKI